MIEHKDKIIQFAIMVLANLIAITLYFYISKALFTWLLPADQCFN